jgi:membrane dipeptidase
MINSLPGFLLCLFALSACQPKEAEAPRTEATPTLAYATELAQRVLIVDGHVDLPYRMRIHNFRIQREYLDPSGSNPKADFDFPRARQGGLNAPFMSIYLPSELQAIPGRSRMLADSLIDMVAGIAERYPDQVRLVGSPDDVQAAFAAGLIALPMGMENGSGLEDDLANVRHFYDRGIRYITLTHAKDNLICDSSYDTTGTWRGVSPYGAQVVKEMNGVGIMVDISHVSDSAFWDVMALTEVPMIASHSSCRYFTPGFERNMDDAMIQALAAKAGVIMINFGSTFVDSTSRARFEVMEVAYQAYLTAEGLTDEDSLQDRFEADYQASHPTLFSDVQRVADHIDHVVALAGVAHVGLGSDYDGVGDSLPRDLKDVSQYPNLVLELLKRGYSPEEIEHICSGNLLRVWQAVIAAAA